MESKQPVTQREIPSQHWRSCKLIIDPVLTNGFYKVYRYDGQHFNMPVQDLGVFPVDTVRDPRVCCLWSKYEETNLVVPRYKIDECYVGPIPPKEVTFARLNDNIKEGFLTDMCKKYGDILEVEIFYNPKNKKHLGIARVIFDTVKAAKESVQHLHETSVMGNVIHVEIDPKGENRMRYLHLLLSGFYTPWTLPVGSDEETLQSLIDNLPSSRPIHGQKNISSPISVATPLSLDTAYSSIWQDTPCSFGLTPRSQGTPRTPCLSGSPLSQDSCYSSLQATPVLQGEPSTCSVHRSLRREVCYRKPTRPYGREHRGSDFSSILKHLKPQPALPLPTQTSHNHKPASWCQNAQSNSTEPSFHLASLDQEYREVLTTTFEASPLSCSSAATCARNRNVAAERQAVASSSSPDSHGRVTESPPLPLDTLPGSPCPGSESHSLDSRIEMLLRRTHCLDAPLFDGKISMAPLHHQGRPASPCSPKYSHASDYPLDCTPPLGAPARVRRYPSHSEPVEVSTTPLPGEDETAQCGSTTPLHEEDETAQAISATPLPGEDEVALAVASLLRNSKTPASFLLTEGRSAGMEMAHANRAPSDKDDTRANSLSVPITKKLQVSNVDMESSNNSLCGALIPGQEIFLPQPPPLASLNRGVQGAPFKPRPLVLPANSIPPFLFPIPLSSNPLPSIPPSLPPFPVRLSNGTIPIPPPGWIAPPGHLAGIPMPPPPIPTPPAALGPPPSLIATPSAMHPAYLYPLPIRPPEPLDKANPPEHGGAPYNGLVWPRLPLPRFNPFVPPPGYMPVKEDPYKVTVERVLGFLIEELKSIIKKDIMRRMVEGVAFKAFDEWWDSQEQKAKVAVTPVKAGEARVKENTKLTDPLSQMTGQRKITHLPSFKVKKGAHGTKEVEGQKNVSSLAHENNSHCESSELGRESNIARYTSEKSTTDGDSCPTQKRRHAKPFELDSDGDEGQEVEDTQNLPGEIVIDGQGNTVENVPKQCDRDNGDDEEEEEEEEDEAQKQKDIEDGDVNVSRTAEGMQVSDSENLLVMESSSSEESEYSSDPSYPSEGTEDSSYYDLSSGEDEGTEEDANEYIVISSDEESMELGQAVSPTAPLTPGTQREQALQEWAEEGLGWDPGQDLYPACRDSPSVLDPVMKFQPSEHQDHLHSLPSIGLPEVEPVFDMEMESPEWRADSLEDMEDLQPLTPTGSLVDSDPDLLIRSRPMPPAAEQGERPRTPGRGVAVLQESEDSVDHLLSLLPADGEPAHRHGPSRPHASYPAYQDMPKTPGREERSIWTLHNSLRVPATPGRSTTPSEGSVVLSPPICSPFPLPSLCGSIYIKTPQTPGRDIILPLRTLVHNRRTPAVTTSQGRFPLCCDEFLRSSSTSPCSLSESSTEAPGQRLVPWISPGARTGPLRGLENVPGLLDEGSQREKATSTTRREQWRWQRRRRRRIRRRQRRRSLPTATRSLGRSHREEMRILHRFWKEGLDEEDARLLEVMYKTLLEEDNGFSWLSDTLWTPHPVAGVSTEQSEEQNNWQRSHKTGSARSEGFYRISKRDKIKYLNDTRLATDLPSTNAQGKCLPPQTQASLRAGSDFRSEQRRLLSSFSCDSDLVKFNQLKYRKKRICFCRSHIHDWGLFAMEPIAAEEMVIEYVGQTIRQIVADTREKRYEDEGIGSSYLFRVDQDTIIDATKCGNLARFINHSCNPNCYAKIITVESQKKIVIYSRQPISVNEEITYDYKFPIEDEKIPCLCGSDGCRGSLN